MIFFYFPKRFVEWSGLGFARDSSILTPLRLNNETFKLSNILDGLDWNK